MEYGDFKPHEVDAFELDHVIAYKQSSKFNSRNVLMEVNLENFLPRKLPTIHTYITPTFISEATYLVLVCITDSKVKVMAYTVLS